MKSIRVATKNRGKLREMREMLEPIGFTVLGVDDIADFEVIEDGDTFAANAVKKARTLMERTGQAAVADDSGIVVDALDGAPGIHSARYARSNGTDQDAANRHKLLDALSDVPDGQRTARFVCALAWCAPEAPPRVFHGRFEGSIGYSERGENGFGYDSIFVVRGDHRTSAELSPEEKNRMSHRGEAMQALLAWLAAEETRFP